MKVERRYLSIRMPVDLLARLDGAIFIMKCSKQAGVEAALELWMKDVEEQYGQVTIQRPPAAVRRKSGS